MMDKLITVGFVLLGGTILLTAVSLLVITLAEAYKTLHGCGVLA